MPMIIRPDIGSELLREKLSRGVGHNSYGEQAWPNDLLYMFPISILGVFGALESSSRYQNPIRRPLASLIFIVSTVITIGLGRNASLPL